MVAAAPRGQTGMSAREGVDFNAVREAADTGSLDRGSGPQSVAREILRPTAIGAGLDGQLVLAGPRVELEEDPVTEIDSAAIGERLVDQTLKAALNRETAGSWHDQEARNQAMFREVNERIEELADGFDAGGRDRLICECGNPECTQQIEVTRAEYKHLRTHGSRFVVALNHENPETETIVEENERFAIVETYAGSASQIARETDPRSQANTRRRDIEHAANAHGSYN